MWILAVAALACLSPLFGAAPAPDGLAQPQTDSPETCDLTADVTLTQAEKDAIVKKHIELRESINKEGGGNYKFKTMEWDDQLAGKAQMAANLCLPKHSFYEYYCPFSKADTAFSGQNYNRHACSDDIDVVAEIRYWWDEHSSYNNVTEDCKEDKICLHYLQEAWAKTFKVGCAYKCCGEEFFFFCNYYPGYRHPDKISRKPNIRPYGEDCMATDTEKECNGHGEYDNDRCMCKCDSTYKGSVCEFEGECNDTDDQCGMMALFCDDAGFGPMVRGMCPKTCGVCN